MAQFGKTAGASSGTARVHGERTARGARNAGRGRQTHPAGQGTKHRMWSDTTACPTDRTPGPAGGTGGTGGTSDGHLFLPENVPHGRRQLIDLVVAEALGMLEILERNPRAEG